MQGARKLVIFDCDGTLVDSQHMICAAMQQAYSALRIECPPRERLLSIVGLSLVEAFERLGEGAQGFPVERLVERYRAAFFACARHRPTWSRYFPACARRSKPWREARHVLGVATGKSQRGVRMVLGHHGLLAHFAPSRLPTTRPRSRIRAWCWKRCATPALPGDTVVIGDTTYDIEMARAAGAAAIGVTWGYHPAPRSQRRGALAVIDRFANLVPTLDRIWAT